MPLSSVAGEARRNTTSGASNSLLFGLVLAGFTCALLAVEGTAVTGAIAQANDYVASGGSTYTIEAQDKINGASCDGLVNLDCVQAAGAIRVGGDSLRFAVLPSSGIPVNEITAGAVDVFNPTTNNQWDGIGILVSQQVADTAGIKPGDQLPLTQGQAIVGGVYDYPDDGRMSGYGYAALIPTTTQTLFDQCWVKTWPVPQDFETLILTTVVNGGEDTPTISRLNTRSGNTLASENLYNNRVSKPSPYVMLVIGFLLGMTAVRMRRLEHASALHSGIPKTALIVQTALESAAWATCGVLIATPAIAHTLLTANDQDLYAVATTLARIPVAALAGVLLGTIIATLTTREKHLFKYFKNR